MCNMLYHISLGHDYYLIANIFVHDEFLGHWYFYLYSAPSPSLFLFVFLNQDGTQRSLWVRSRR